MEGIEEEGRKGRGWGLIPSSRREEKVKGEAGLGKGEGRCMYMKSAGRERRDI